MTTTTLHLFFDGDALHRDQVRAGKEAGKHFATDFGRVIEFASSEAFGARDVVARFYARENERARKLYGHLEMFGVSLRLDPRDAPWQAPKEQIATAIDQVANEDDSDVILVGGDGYGGRFSEALRRIPDGGQVTGAGLWRKIATSTPTARRAGVIHWPGLRGTHGVNIASWDIVEIGAAIERDWIEKPVPMPTSRILVLIDESSIKHGIARIGGRVPGYRESISEWERIAGYVRSKAEPGSTPK